MTKYVLHGGEKRNGVVDDSDFFSELTSIDKPLLNVLLVYFARPEYLWQELSVIDTNLFEGNVEKSIVTKVATVDSFEEDLFWADIIYIKGGDGPILTNVLSRYHDLKSKFDGKVIGAISAGVNALSKYYYSRKGGKVLIGLGILDMKIFTHFEKYLTEELAELEGFGEDVGVLTISEGEFVVVNN